VAIELYAAESGVNDCADEKRWRISAGERVRSRGARANPKAGDAKINSCARGVTAPPVVICYSLNCGDGGSGGGGGIVALSLLKFPPLITQR
jgi:hypothetical protein